MADVFSPETIDFLWGLRLNNNRAWFQANKAAYTDHLQQPLRALGTRVYEALRDEFPGLGLNLHICRVYRDARRLYGRGPFKENLWFVLEQPGETARPGFYFDIASDRYGYGMGFFDAPAAVMQAYRQDIDRNLPHALALAERFAAQDDFVLGGPRYARSKGGPGGLLDRWYNARTLVLQRERTPDEALFDPALAERMVEGFRFLMPYYQWLYGIADRESADGRDAAT